MRICRPVSPPHVVVTGHDEFVAAYRIARLRSDSAATPFKPLIRLLPVRLVDLRFDLDPTRRGVACPGAVFGDCLLSIGRGCLCWTKERVIVLQCCGLPVY